MDTYGRGSGVTEHDCFPRTQGLVERPVLRPAGNRSTRPSDGQHSGSVQVSAVLVDVTQERVVQPVSTALTGKDADTDCASQLDRQAELGSGLSLQEEVVTGVDCCDFVVGGPTAASRSGADGDVDCFDYDELGDFDICPEVTFLTEPVNVVSSGVTYQETDVVLDGSTSTYVDYGGERGGWDGWPGVTILV